MIWRLAQVRESFLKRTTRKKTPHVTPANRNAAPLTGATDSADYRETASSNFNNAAHFQGSDLINNTAPRLAFDGKAAAACGLANPLLSASASSAQSRPKPFGDRNHGIEADVAVGADAREGSRLIAFPAMDEDSNHIDDNNAVSFEKANVGASDLCQNLWPSAGVCQAGGSVGSKFLPSRDRDHKQENHHTMNMQTQLRNANSNSRPSNRDATSFNADFKTRKSGQKSPVTCLNFGGSSADENALHDTAPSQDSLNADCPTQSLLVEDADKDRGSVRTNNISLHRAAMRDILERGHNALESGVAAHGQQGQSRSKPKRPQPIVGQRSTSSLRSPPTRHFPTAENRPRRQACVASPQLDFTDPPNKGSASFVIHHSATGPVLQTSGSRSGIDDNNDVVNNAATSDAPRLETTSFHRPNAEGCPNPAAAVGPSTVPRRRLQCRKCHTRKLSKQKLLKTTRLLHVLCRSSSSRIRKTSITNPENTPGTRRTRSFQVRRRPQRSLAERCLPRATSPPRSLRAIVQCVSKRRWTVLLATIKSPLVRAAQRKMLLRWCSSCQQSTSRSCKWRKQMAKSTDHTDASSAAPQNAANGPAHATHWASRHTRVRRTALALQQKDNGRAALDNQTSDARGKVAFEQNFKSGDAVAHIPQHQRFELTENGAGESHASCRRRLAAGVAAVACCIKEQR